MNELPGWVREVAGVEVDADATMAKPARFRLTDLGNAERLVHFEGADLCWVANLGWHVWTGQRWERDREGHHAVNVAKRVVRRIPAEIELWADEDAEVQKSAARRILKHADRSEQHHAIRSMLALAASTLVSSLDDFDADPYLLNVQNGTVNLRTGELRPHRRADRLTQVCTVAYDPAARAPAWEAFVRWAMRDDAELVSWLQRFAGYAISGSTGEQMFACFFGAGANGKSTFVEVVAHVLGDYSTPAPPGFLMARFGAEEHPTSLAGLVGRRFVPCSETERDKKLDEARVKQLTGGERIAARMMRQDFFSFLPLFKLVLLTNAKPVIVGTDHGIWRRLALVPWEATATRPDRDLKERLLAEAPGILNWLIDGCRRWQAEGLEPVKRMKEAAGAYREDMDQLGLWLTERCHVGAAYRDSADSLFRCFKSWAIDRNETPCSQRTFGIRLAERGFVGSRGTGGRRMWDGVAVRFDTP